MSLEIIRRFKCDRCGTVQDIHHDAQFPLTWLEILLFTETNANHQHPTGTRLLCQDCKTEFMKFLAKE